MTKQTTSKLEASRKAGINRERTMKIMLTTRKEHSVLNPIPGNGRTRSTKSHRFGREASQKAGGSVAKPNGSISAYGPARSTITGAPLRPEELEKIDAYWRASLYLCVGMLFLKENPLLHEPLKMEHIKARLLGHWGSDAGQAFTYIHFNRLIKKYDLNAIFLSGPGHGAPAVLSDDYLEGTYSEIYPEMTEDAAGMQRFFKQFSFPGGIGNPSTSQTTRSLS